MSFVIHITAIQVHQRCTASYSTCPAEFPMCREQYIAGIGTKTAAIESAHATLCGNLLSLLDLLKYT